MTSEEKVKQLWPEAVISRITTGSSTWGFHRKYMVMIKPGRYAYGKMKSWAWKEAWESISQDEELSKGALAEAHEKGEDNART